MVAEEGDAKNQVMNNHCIDLPLREHLASARQGSKSWTGNRNWPSHVKGFLIIFNVAWRHRNVCWLNQNSYWVIVDVNLIEQFEIENRAKFLKFYISLNIFFTNQCLTVINIVLPQILSVKIHFIFSFICWLLYMSRFWTRATSWGEYFIVDKCTLTAHVYRFIQDQFHYIHYIISNYQFTW